MSRGVGEIEFVAGLPDWVAIVAAVVTALGDVWFVFLLLGTLYWFGSEFPGPVSLSRQRVAFAIALAFGGLTTTTAIKELLRLPRPPGASEPAGGALVPEAVLPLYAEIGAASGFGFPSGHAVTAVVVFGGLGLLVGSRRGYVTAAALCVLIPLSRIVLGVHYLVDVVVGLALGGAFLAMVYLVGNRGRNPGRAFTIALGVALVGAGLTYTTDTMIALGGALGGRMAWGIVGQSVVYEAVTRVGGAIAAAVGLGSAGLFVVIYVLEPAPYVSFVGMFIVVWGVLVAPLAGEAMGRRIP